MVRSMTGYGRFEGVIDGRKIAVEIKSVNHRFLEISMRTGRGYGFVEERLKEVISSYASRGKIDVYVSLESDENAAADVKINHSLAAGYVNAFRELSNTYEIKNDITVSILSRCCNDIFTVSKAPEDEERVISIVEKAVTLAAEGFVKMREREGKRLQNDVSERCEKIVSLVDEIEKISPQLVEDYRKRLYEKISDVPEAALADPQRILTEAAIFADKTAVDEETVRLKSHISQFKDMLSKNEPVGRKLDFIVQEMNREANTIGSKVCSAGIAHMVVEMKSEIEKIREQIQNIE